jgi:ribokinase
MLDQIKSQQRKKLEVVVIGSAALDIYGRLDALPRTNECVFVEEVKHCPGGMSLNVSVALSRLSVGVAFSGKIAVDSAGRMIVEHLVKNDVNLSNVHLVEEDSLQTLILDSGQMSRWIFAIGSNRSAISLESRDAINSDLLDLCKIVYIGEVFVEVASSIADHAQSKKKTVIYRPGSPYMKFGTRQLGSVLAHTNYFILNEPSWNLLKSSDGEISDPSDLLQYGPDKIILTKASQGCEVFSADESREFSIPLPMKTRFAAVDSTGAGDSFSAGLIKGLLNGWNFSQATVYAQTAASIACSRKYAADSFPNEEEVEAAMKSSRM